MKKLFFYFIPFFSILVSCGKGVSLQTDDPIEYHNFVDNKQDKVSMSILQLSGAMRLSDKELLEKEYQKTTQEINKTLDEVERMADFKGDRTYKDATVDMVRFYQVNMDVIFKEVVELKKRGSLTVPEQLKIKEMMTVFVAKEKTVNEAFLDARKKFATKYNVPIIELSKDN